jgi:hypothetical protein
MMFLTVCTKVLANNDLIFTGILRPLEESEMQSSQHQNKSVMVQERDMIAMLPVRLFVIVLFVLCVLTADRSQQ